MNGDRVFSCQPGAWLRAWLCVRFENVCSQRLTTSVLLHLIAVCCSMLQYVAVYCSMLQYVAARCSGAFWKWYSQLLTVSLRYWRRVCCYSILQRVAVRCSMLQRVAVRESAIDDDSCVSYDSLISLAITAFEKSPHIIHIHDDPCLLRLIHPIHLYASLRYMSLHMTHFHDETRLLWLVHILSDK